MKKVYKSKDDTNDKRSYLLKLSKTEIEMLKKALHYYMMVEETCYAFWYIGGGSTGTRDQWHLNIASRLWSELKHLSQAKLELGDWGSIGYLHKLLKKEVEEYRKENDYLIKKYGTTELHLDDDQREDYRKKSK